MLNPFKVYITIFILKQLYKIKIKIYFIVFKFIHLIQKISSIIFNFIQKYSKYYIKKSLNY